MRGGRPAICRKAGPRGFCLPLFQTACCTGSLHPTLRSRTYAALPKQCGCAGWVATLLAALAFTKTPCFAWSFLQRRPAVRLGGAPTGLRPPSGATPWGGQASPAACRHRATPGAGSGLCPPPFGRPLKPLARPPPGAGSAGFAPVDLSWGTTLRSGTAPGKSPAPPPGLRPGPGGNAPHVPGSPTATSAPPPVSRSGPGHVAPPSDDASLVQFPRIDRDR